ncbi:MAG: DUF11 domain-containing protein [Candidatus Schekmanbacteria bacterium]|nr:DUF11 domain-containing protein [Candidatus Schekmanbacteria bacterium]
MHRWQGIEALAWACLRAALVVLIGGGLAASAAFGSDVSVAIEDSPDPVGPGGQITYAITVMNAGAGEASDVVMADTIDTRVTLVSVTPQTGACTPQEYVITCNLGALAESQSTRVDIVVTTTEVGTMANGAVVSAAGIDPNPADNAAYASTEVSDDASADLRLTATDAPDPVAVGGTVRYVLTIANNGPATALAVVITDLLPSQATFVAAEASAGGCSEESGTVTCVVARLTTSQEATVTIDATANETGRIVNSAAVTSSSGDPSSTNNIALSETVVADPASADTGVNLVDSADPVAVGQVFSYVATVRNNGPATATAITVTFMLSGDLTYLGSAGGRASCSEGRRAVTCALASLGVGVEEQVAITVSSGAVGSASAVVTADGAEADADLTNNERTESTEVVEAVPVLAGAPAVACVACLAAAWSLTGCRRNRRRCR